MFVFSKKKGPVLGLDINGDSIVLAQLERTKVGMELVHFSHLPTPPNAVREGLIADPDTVGNVLRELLDQAGITAPNAQVNVAVPGQSVVVRLMPVPTGMPEDELADVVAQEAINHVPFPMREANLDWSIMSATERTDPDGVRRVDVILSAIQRTIVDSYWRMASVAGIRLGRIDISSLSVIRALSFAGYLDATDQLSTIVTIRHDATDINLVKNGMPLFSRSVLLGVETLGEAVSRSLDIHLDEALALLPQIQLFGMASPDPKLGQAGQIARTVFGDITDEVGRSLEFYRSQVGEVAINQVILCGPGCIVPQLDLFMSNRLNIQSVVANPLRDVIFDEALVPQERRASQTMLLGVMAQPDNLPLPVVELDINKEGPSTQILEGLEARQTVRIAPVDTPWFAPALSAGVLLLLIMFGLWMYFAQYDVPKKQAELEQLDTEIQMGKKQLKNLDVLRQDNDILKRKKRLLDQIVHEGHPWAAILQVVRESTPPETQVKRIMLSGSNMIVDGISTDFTKVSHLTINLGGSRLLTDSNIDYVKRDEKDPREVAFRVVARVRPGVTPADQNAPQLTSRPQVLDFYADWCPPCQEMKPVIEEQKAKYGERIDFVALNADDPGARAMFEKYDVKQIPTLCFLNAKGELVEKIVGYEGQAPIVAALEKVTQIAASGATK